jgi:hypothetical protein
MPMPEPMASLPPKRATTEPSVGQDQRGGVGEDTAGRGAAEAPAAELAGARGCGTAAVDAVDRGGGEARAGADVVWRGVSAGRSGAAAT